MEKDEFNHIDPARLEELLARIGVTVLSMAAVLTVVELDHARPKAHTTGKLDTAAYRTSEMAAGEQKQYVRKDKEKTEHMTHSFGVLMRSHPTAGSA